MPGMFSMYQKAAAYVGNYSKSMLNQGNIYRAGAAAGVRDVMTGMKGYSGGARRTAYGAMAGGAYGAMSDDTSILGGATAGALGGRYLGAGFSKASRSGVGIGSFTGSAKAYGQAFGRGVRAQARADYRGARLAANRGYNRIKGIGHGWMGGFGAGI